MKAHEFAILHDFENTQFLANSSYDSDNDQYKIDIKFWNDTVNGFIELSLGFDGDFEDKFEEAFDSFKNSEKALDLMKQIEESITFQEEL